MAHMAQLLRGQRRFALLYMDCDRFKQINDSLGHAMADNLLRALGCRLSLDCANTGIQVWPSGRTAALYEALGLADFGV